MVLFVLLGNNKYTSESVGLIGIFRSESVIGTFF